MPEEEKTEQEVALEQALPLAAEHDLPAQELATLIRAGATEEQAVEISALSQDDPAAAMAAFARLGTSEE